MCTTTPVCRRNLTGRSVSSPFSFLTPLSHTFLLIQRRTAQSQLLSMLPPCPPPTHSPFLNQIQSTHHSKHCTGSKRKLHFHVYHLYTYPLSADKLECVGMLCCLRMASLSSAALEAFSTTCMSWSNLKLIKSSGFPSFIFFCAASTVSSRRNERCLRFLTRIPLTVCRREFLNSYPIVRSDAKTCDRMTISSLCCLWKSSVMGCIIVHGALS
mmetsp:Transcript_52837/g.103323  ORF Transcript_52837/g.103323 Transcript_52837/m.103323 type:complete len:213 (+) Transcript_52837:451-1089(+)